MDAEATSRHDTEFLTHTEVAPQSRGQSDFSVLSPAAIAQPSGRTEKGLCRILLVDDNADIVESLAVLLGFEGHDVRCALSGAEALVVAREFKPEVMVLDIGMPRMDGYELARRLRQEHGLDRPTLIAVSGWGSSEDKAEAATAGFDLHLTKPVDPGQLLQVIGERNRWEPGCS